MRIRHVELHQAERIGRTRLLDHGDIAVRTARRGIARTPRPGGVVEHFRAKPLALHDRLRHRPCRVEDHAFDAFGQLRRRRAAGLADHGAIGFDNRIVDRQAQLVFGHVRDQVLRAEIALQPAPAIHVGLDERAAAGFRLARQFALQRSVVGMGRGDFLQRAGDIVAGQRTGHDLRGREAVGIGIDHEPLAAVGHRGAPVAHVLDQPGEGVARLFVQHHALARGDRRAQFARIVIRRNQAVRIDALDDFEQLACIG